MFQQSIHIFRVSNLEKQCRKTKSICLKKVKMNYISDYLHNTLTDGSLGGDEADQGKSDDFHGDVLRGVKKMKSDIDKQVFKKSEQKDQRDLPQKYGALLHLQCSSFCFYVISVILDYVFYNFKELCKINSLSRNNFEANIIIYT